MILTPQPPKKSKQIDQFVNKSGRLSHFNVYNLRCWIFATSFIKAVFNSISTLKKKSNVVKSDFDWLNALIAF